MRSALFLTCLLLRCAGVAAQDLIVTNAGDSIHCAINGKVDGMLDYSTEESYGIHARAIELAEVRSYSIGKGEPYFPNPRNHGKGRAPLGQGNGSHNVRRRFEASILAGLSSFTDNNTTGLSALDVDRMQQFRDGLAINVSVRSWLGDHFGIGLDYSGSFVHRSAVDVPVVYDDGQVGTIPVRENIGTDCLSLNIFGTADLIDARFRAVAGAGFGFMVAHDDVDLVQHYVVNGSGTALKILGEINFRVTERSFMFGQVAYIRSEDVTSTKQNFYTGTTSTLSWGDTSQMIIGLGYCLCF